MNEKERKYEVGNEIVSSKRLVLLVNLLSLALRLTIFAVFLSLYFYKILWTKSNFFASKHSRSNENATIV